MAERTTVRLPEQLLSRAKRKAAVEGRTFTSLIEEGLRLIVSDEKKRAREKRVQPRISKATGGPMPGIELADLSRLQEIDDLDYIRRTSNFE
jgi:Arc/MetJ-type ribon-helix-helix transcriptional regulator